MGFVIGTAGHIDHGKTSLVRSLTGQDTDQLPSEKERGISIDLGFAHFELPNHKRVGIIDVPGHERFIRNMAAGAHGLDLVLFVIAADDGVMPQSEEHFDILCSLGVMRAIFVVTKVDMVDDARFEEVKDEIEILVDGSPFQGAPVLPVSNASGTGIGKLMTLIADTLFSVKRNDSIDQFRMPIDRVFTIHGRGVVITGTPVSGILATGDEVVIVPGEETYRVRGLQCHGIDVDQGRSGDRLAINLTGADFKALHRGDVACDPAIARHTDRIDVSLSVTPHAVCDLKNAQRLRLHLGTAERSGTVTLLGESLVINKGNTGLAQIKLTDPLQAMAGDRFVVRDEQAEHTLGGGRVLDPVGTKFRKTDTLRFARLAALDEGKPVCAVEMLIDSSSALGILAADLKFRMNITEDALLGIVKTSESLMKLKVGSEDWITSVTNLDTLNGNIKSVLAAFHKDQPATPGLGFEVLHYQITDLPVLYQVMLKSLVCNSVSRHSKNHTLSDADKLPLPYQMGNDSFLIVVL